MAFMEILIFNSTGATQNNNGICRPNMVINATLAINVLSCSPRMESDTFPPLSPIDFSVAYIPGESILFTGFQPKAKNDDLLSLILLCRMYYF